MGPLEPESDPSGGSGQYPTTHWSQLLAAREADAAAALPALEVLCERYHPAIVGYFRRKLKHTTGVEDAEDLAHSFFATRWIERDFFRHLEQEKVLRFRHYLTRCLKNFWVEWWRKTHSLKNNSGQPPLPLTEPGMDLDTDIAVDGALEQLSADREIALRVHQLAWQQLAGEIRDPHRFTRLRRFVLLAPEGDDYERAAQELTMSHANVRKIISRWRSRYLDFFRREVTRTVAGHPEEIAGEIKELLQLLLDEVARSRDLERFFVTGAPAMRNSK